MGDLSQLNIISYKYIKCKWTTNACDLILLRCNFLDDVQLIKAKFMSRTKNLICPSLHHVAAVLSTFVPVQSVSSNRAS